MLILYRDLLKQSHPNQERAVLNYVAIISRVFKYVSSAIEKAEKPPQHWSDMLQEDQLVIQYLDKWVNPIEYQNHYNPNQPQYTVYLSD